MNLIKFLLLIVALFILIAFSIGYYEKQDDTEKSVNKIFKTLGSFGLLFIFGYLIISKIDTGKITIFGYKMEKGLLIYVSILFFMTFLL